MCRSSVRITGVITVLGLLLSGSGGLAGVPGQDGRAPSPGPVARWTFDAPPAGAEVADAASGTKDAIRGRFRAVPGVAGGGLAFDGYTTCVVRKGRQAPRLGEAFTIEAWVALAALPWNWVPVVGQESSGLIGYSFGVGPLGEFGLKVSMRGAWAVCLSPVKLPLRKWSHIAATFRADEAIRLFLDGREVASLPVKGAAAYAGGADLLIGMNPDKRLPSHIVAGGAGTIPAWFAFDGIMDEISLYGRALAPDELARLHAAVPAPALPALSARLLPSGPKGPGRFGAYYTKLVYDDGWTRCGPPGRRPTSSSNSTIRPSGWCSGAGRGTGRPGSWTTGSGWPTRASRRGTAPRAAMSTWKTPAASTRASGSWSRPRPGPWSTGATRP